MTTLLARRSALLFALAFPILFPDVLRADVVEYEVTFNATWSAATHPDAYPANAHFSGLIGGTHNTNVQFWQLGELASDGIERMAETGAKSPLNTEVDAAIQAGDAYSLISGGGIGRSPNSVSQRFEISSTHPLATVVSMIAPSPDWFVGVSGLNLRDAGRWLAEVSVDLDPYDAGTDSGADLTSPNDDTNPAERIHLLTSIAPFQGTPPLGTFTFRLVSLPGDLNGSGAYDADDANMLCGQIGSSDSRYDFTDDGAVGGADLTFWLESLVGTRAGDLNLDGRIDFDDFLVLSNHFTAAADYSEGDVNCDGQVQFADFLTLSQNFGFNASSSPAASVPEPTGIPLTAVALPWLAARRRRRLSSRR